VRISHVPLYWIAAMAGLALRQGAMAFIRVLIILRAAIFLAALLELMEGTG